MIFWIFTSEAAAGAANDLCAAALPPDTLVNGDEAPVQITSKWAAVRRTTDGLWTIPAMDGVTPANLHRLGDQSDLAVEDE